MWHLLDALKRFENLEARRVGEITFEVARLGESLSRRHGDTEKSSRSERRRPRRHQQLSLRGLYGNSAKPNSSRYGPNSCACRIQTHRSRARYRHGFELALDYCAGAVQYWALGQSPEIKSHEPLRCWAKSCPLPQPIPCPCALKHGMHMLAQRVSTRRHPSTKKPPPERSHPQRSQAWLP